MVILFVHDADVLMGQVVVLKRDMVFLRFQDKSRRELGPCYSHWKPQRSESFGSFINNHTLRSEPDTAFNCTHSKKVLPFPL